MNKFAKAIGALLGGVSAAVLITLAHLLGLSLDPTLAGSIAAVLSGIGAYLAPKNADSPAAPPTA